MTALQRSMIRELPDDQSGLRLQLWNFVGNESFSFLINLTDPVASWDKHEGFCDTKKTNWQSFGCKWYSQMWHKTHNWFEYKDC